MTRVIADDGLKSRLKDFSESLEICDESGKVVGYFQPMTVSDREIYDWAKAEFTAEEIEKARQDPVSFSTAEVLEHLRSL
jgi:hypothetical protein